MKSLGANEDVIVAVINMNWNTVIEIKQDTSRKFLYSIVPMS